MNDTLQLGFPLWVRLTHFFNFVFLTLLIRSEIGIIGGHPKFYWRDHTLLGSEWFRLTKKRIPKDKLWTSEDEIEPMSWWTALPKKQPRAGSSLALLAYVHFGLPPEGNPFNAIQQLTYCFIIFILSQLQIITGIMMSPALGSRFPWFPNILGGRQAARSLHFIGLIVFIGFIIVHIGLVIAHGFGREMAKIVLGNEGSSHVLAMTIGLLAIAAVIAFHFWGTWYSLVFPSRAKRLLEIGVDSLRRLLFHHWDSRQNSSHVSAYARINGRPPRNETYRKLAASGFANWRLDVTGLVNRNLSLSLNDLHQMPRQTQTTLHCCIQGWSYLAQWTGVPVSAIMDACEALSDARFLVFHTLDEKWEKPGHGCYYEVIHLEVAVQPQTILAYEVNGRPLPIPHGAPLRLRVDNQLGYKMAKWINRIEVVNSFKRIGKGEGGWRDDLLHYYPLDAGI